MSAVNRSDFISKVFLFFGGAIGLSALGVWGGLLLAQSNPELFMNPVIFYGAIVVELILAFSVGIWSKKLPMGYVIFSAFALLSGFTLAPLLFLAGAIGGVSIILKAFIATVCMFAASALFGWATKKDLSSMGGILFTTLIGLIVVGILNIFIQSSVLEITLSGVGVVLFSAFTAYDIQNIKSRYPDHMFLAAAMGLYLSFINLFVSILRLLLAFAQD